VDNTVFNLHIKQSKSPEKQDSPPYRREIHRTDESPSSLCKEIYVKVEMDKHSRSVSPQVKSILKAAAPQIYENKAIPYKNYTGDRETLNVLVPKEGRLRHNKLSPE
jgi:hypothetical protein